MTFRVWAGVKLGRVLKSDETAFTTTLDLNADAKKLYGTFEMIKCYATKENLNIRHICSMWPVVFVETNLIVC